MNPQLEQLIMLNDIDLMIKEVSDEEQARQIKVLGFKLNHLEQLFKAREEIRGKIDRELIGRYDKLIKRYGRAMVPINGRICYGCFMQLPVNFVSQPEKNNAVLNCPKCGRFLYWV